VNIPKRGEIYWVDWEQGKGSEQSGTRPSLIIQNDIANEHSPNVIIASITTAPNKSYPFLVNILPQQSGLQNVSTVDLGSIVTISKTRLVEKCGQLTPTQMSEIDLAICVSLAIKRF